MDTKEVPGRAKEILRKIFLSRIFLIVAGVIVLYTAVGFFLVPYLIKQQAIKYVTQSLSRQLTIDEVAANPYTFTLSIRTLDFKEQDATPILGFKDLFINFELFSSLKNWAFTFALIRLDEPRVNVLMRKDGKLNLWNWLLQQQGKKAKNRRGILSDPHDPAAIPNPVRFSGCIRPSGDHPCESHAPTPQPGDQ